MARAMAEPSGTRKVGFWSLLGLTSTAFAEVAFPGSPFDVVTLLLVVGPVYTLHAVVLAGVLFGADRVSLASLYLGGTLLGLYEAYITKVVWAPVGEPLPVRVAGVYPLETLSLVLFWHPLMAFLVPVAVVETAATNSGRSLPASLVGHRYAAGAAAAVVVSVAVFRGTLGVGPATTVVETTVASGSLLATLAVWRRAGGHRYGMGALLPTGRELWVLGGLLFGLYLLFGLTLRPEALPMRPGPHLPVVAMYVALGGLVLVAIRRADGHAPEGTVAFTWARALGVVGTFVVVSAVAGLLLVPLADVVFLAYFVGSATAGVGVLAYAGARALGWRG